MPKKTSKDGKGFVVRTCDSSKSSHDLLLPEVFHKFEIDPNIDRLADHLFRDRRDQGAVQAWFDSFGTRLKLSGKLKEAEILAEIANQVRSLLSDAVDIQSFKKRLELVYLEAERNRMEFEAQSPLIPELAREKMKLEIKKVQLQQKEIEDKMTAPKEARTGGQEKLRREAAIRANEKAIKAFEGFQTRKAIENEAQYREQEIKEMQRAGELSKEEALRALEDLEDMKQYALDNLENL